MSEIKSDKLTPVTATTTTFGDSGDKLLFATGTNLDMNGVELILDADGNTSITADTDDQIDIRIGGADDFSFKANKFEVQTGSNIDMNGTELILDANGNTSITADTDDQIDIKISGADDFRFTANNFNILSGSTLTVDSGATITNSGTATNFGGLILLDTQTASSSSSLDFTTGITSTYSAYLFVLDAILNASVGADMWVRISDDGGSSYEAAGTDYEYVITKREANGNSFVGHGASQGAAQMLISASQDTSGGHMGGTVWLFSPASTAAFPVFKSDVIYMNTDSPQMLRQDHSIGVYNGATAAVDGIRFLYSSGNIVSGVIRLYGIAK